MGLKDLGWRSYGRLLVFSIIITIITTFILVAGAALFRSSATPYLTSDTIFWAYIFATLFISVMISYQIYNWFMQEKIHWTF
jgi:ABC-type sugar transport system permease subunit